MLILFFCPTVALCLVFHILCTQPEYGRHILYSVVRVFPVKHTWTTPSCRGTRLRTEPSAILSQLSTQPGGTAA
jgi:hypothetical protein